MLNTGPAIPDHFNATQPTREFLLIPIGVEDGPQSYNDPVLPIALCMRASSWLRFVGARTSRISALQNRVMS
ncbi:MAG: hypothetical protein WAK35_22710 [Xanthobacteraceae bacterium]